MEINVVRLHRIEGENRVKAFADVEFDEELLVKGIMLIHSRNGLFVSMPREQGKDGLWYDKVKPLKGDLRSRLHQAIMAAYEKAEQDSDQAELSPLPAESN
ncbi:MAG: SpoVG family protein [Candidatus Omnitrophica bacterium]|nr:SpoVG family protein [Candidatus Omnitrophota bacterium]